MTEADNDEVEFKTRQWLQDVVVGLNLCPFAKRFVISGTVRFTVSQAVTEEELLKDFFLEVEQIEQTPIAEVETSLLIIPNMLNDFLDYNQFLDLIDGLLIQFNWEGVYQVASFHPNYCFADTKVNDADNLTNRSPYPILHLLREESLEKAIDSHSDIESIPMRNIKLMRSLTADDKTSLFPYLFNKN